MTRKNHLQAISVVVILMLGIVWRVSWLRARDNNVYETVLRYITTGLKREDALIFVSVNGSDPSSDFLKRFEKGTPDILPLSRGIPVPDSANGTDRLFDKQRNTSSFLINFRSVQWQDANNISVQLDYSGFSTIYWFHKENQKWKIVDRQQHWTE